MRTAAQRENIEHAKRTFRPAQPRHVTDPAPRAGSWWQEAPADGFTARAAKLFTARTEPTYRTRQDAEMPDGPVLE